MGFYIHTHPVTTIILFKVEIISSTLKIKEPRVF